MVFEVLCFVSTLPNSLCPVCKKYRGKGNHTKCHKELKAKGAQKKERPKLKYLLKEYNLKFLKDL